MSDIIVDPNDPNLSECRKLAGTVRDTVLAVIANETQCVTEKLETGKGYVANIAHIAEEITGELKGLQGKAQHCTQGVHGMKGTAHAIICINKVG